MKSSKLKVVLGAIKQSYSYSNNQIKVEQSEGRIKVYSIGKESECFYDTDTLSLLNAMNVSNYLAYDYKLKKVVVHIF